MPDRTARRQHKAAALTTAARIERLAAQARDDLEHDRPVSVPGEQIVMAAAAFLAELAAMRVRDEMAARKAREAAA
jgi:hypothetical protein